VNVVLCVGVVEGLNVFAFFDLKRLYVGCRKNFLGVKFWVSVCVCGSVQISEWCFVFCLGGSCVTFYVVKRHYQCCQS
jgi:hypothetical protein